MRNRPGKRERMRAAKAERMAVIQGNLSQPKPERPMYGAPVGFRSSMANRDTLKSKSHDIGFVAPRGFYTPSDTVPKDSVKWKRENVGAIVPNRRGAGEREEAMRLAAIVKGWDGETQK